MKKKLKIFLIFEYTLFVMFFLYLFFQGRPETVFTDVIFFILVLFLTSNLSSITNTGKEIITSFNLPILMSAMPLGPFWAGLVALIGAVNLQQIKNVFKWYQFVFNQTVMFLAASSGALVFQFCQNYFDTPSVVLPFFAAALTYFIINNGLVYIVISIDKNKEMASVFIYFLELLKSMIPSFFLGLIFYYGYVYLGKMIFVLGIILIYIIKDFLFTRIQMINSFTQIIESFLKVIDSKDHYTEGHCERVARYVDTLGETLNIRKRKLDRIINIAKIHDIGKIYVDDKILKKSDTLTKAEYEEMKNHSRYGYELLQDIDLMNKDLEIILYHHERYDGSGYPENLEGKEIPVGARLLNICDAFDVMTTGRTYKPPCSKKEVVAEFKKCAGNQFDPEFVKKMIELIEKGIFDKSFIKVRSGKSATQKSFTTAEVRE